MERELHEVHAPLAIPNSKRKFRPPQLVLAGSHIRKLQSRRVPVRTPTLRQQIRHQLEPSCQPHQRLKAEARAVPQTARVFTASFNLLKVREDLPVPIEVEMRSGRQAVDDVFAEALEDYDTGKEGLELVDLILT